MSGTREHRPWVVLHLSGQCTGTVEGWRGVLARVTELRPHYRVWLSVAPPKTLRAALQSCLDGVGASALSASTQSVAALEAVTQAALSPRSPPRSSPRSGGALSDASPPRPSPPASGSPPRHPGAPVSPALMSSEVDDAEIVRRAFMSPVHTRPAVPGSPGLSPLSPRAMGGDEVDGSESGAGRSGDTTIAGWRKQLAAVSRLVRRLSAELHATVGDEGGESVAMRLVGPQLTALENALVGTSMVGLVSPAITALVHSFGPLLISLVGHAFLSAALHSHEVRADRAGSGVAVSTSPVAHVDTRKLLRATRVRTSRYRLVARDIYLKARTNPVCNPKAIDAAANGADVVLSQSGVAESSESGRVCILAPQLGGTMAAGLIAVMASAERLIKLTHNHGVFTCDPATPGVRPRLLRRLSYRDARELAAAGVNVMHPLSLVPVVHGNIALEIRHFAEPMSSPDYTVVTETGEEAEVDDESVRPTLARRDGASSGRAAAAAAAAAVAAGSAAVAAGAGAGDAAPATASPAAAGTVTSGDFVVSAIAVQRHTTLMSMATFDMWGSPGFLAAAFEPLAAHGVSVDQISTSQGDVTVTLDDVPGGAQGSAIKSVVAKLSELCSVKVDASVAVVTLFGHNLLAGLRELAPALKALHGIPIKVLNGSSMGVSLSFVVADRHADDAVARLHGAIFGGDAGADAAPPQLVAAKPVIDAANVGATHAELVAGMYGLRDTDGRSGADGGGGGRGDGSGGGDSGDSRSGGGGDTAGVSRAVSALKSPAAPAPRPVPQSPVAKRPVPIEWWRRPANTARLLKLLEGANDSPDAPLSLYCYDLHTVRERCESLVAQIPSVAHFYYAIKANGHPDVLRTAAAAGVRMECVSANEVRHVRSVLGDDVPILFTPNFAPVREYVAAYERGAEVTVDGPDILRLAPDVFKGREVAVRIDPGRGSGHSKKVMTAGAAQKFGHPVEDVDEFVAVARDVGATVVGLHTHVGSGVLDARAWVKTARMMSTLLDRRDRAGALLFPSVRWIDVGGGLGVPERAGQPPLDLRLLDESLRPFAAAMSSRPRPVELHMEPGRFVCSEAGVLLTTVTQVRSKGSYTFVGVEAGMNALIRPALYGSWHSIYNLTRLSEPVDEATSVQVVGPICETGDYLGKDRRMPTTVPGDVILVANGGAYGAVMASRYNRRAVPEVALAEDGSAPVVPVLDF